MSADMKNKCVGELWGGYVFHVCGAKASLEHEGEHFCKRHHPPTVAAKKAAKHAAWNAKRDAENAVRNKRDSEAAEQKRRADLYPDLLAVCQAILRYQALIDSDQTWGFVDAYAEAFEAAEVAVAKATGAA